MSLPPYLVHKSTAVTLLGRTMDWLSFVLSLVLGFVFLLLSFYFLLVSRPSQFPPGPPNLPLIGAYPFLSGCGLEKFFGPQVQEATLKKKVVHSFTGLFLWPGDWSLCRLVPHNCPQRLAPRQESFCKRGVLRPSQVKRLWFLLI